MQITPKETGRLKEKAYASIKQLILSREFSPGSLLSERQLSGRLGMSKTPVKAALERLESEGFISVAPQQGIIVRDLTVDEIADQFEIRNALESFVLRSIAGKLNATQLAEIDKNLLAQKLAVEQCNQAQAVSLDAEFHAMFCTFLGNQEIVRVMLNLREKMHRVVAGVMSKTSDRMKNGYLEHVAIADAVRSGNADLAASALEQHLNIGKELLLSPRRSLNYDVKRA